MPARLSASRSAPERGLYNRPLCCFRLELIRALATPRPWNIGPIRWFVWLRPFDNGSQARDDDAHNTVACGLDELGVGRGVDLGVVDPHLHLRSE